ncbi:MAG: prolipoprotein diacylglyceryl transferase [Chloroflexi bacterium]|nr:prolipoprotein diacylglyceryl transferase [Chloroflexota bacterium]
MIEINIDPVLFQGGPFVITWHGFFTAVGVLAGIMLAVRLGALLGFSEEDITSVALWAVIGGIIGARLMHVVDQWDFYVRDPMKIVMINEGGLAIFGTVLGGPLVGAIYAWRRGFSVARLLDVGAPCLLLGMAIGRIGDIINGEHHGTPAAGLPFSVSYTHPNTLGEPGVAVHSAVTYEMLLDLLILGVLVGVFGRMPRSSMVFWLFSAAYSFARFFVQFFRVDTIFAAGLSQAQLMSFVVGAAAVWALVFLSARSRKNASGDPGVAAARGAADSGT